VARLWSSGAELGTAGSGVEFVTCSATVQSTVKRSGTYAVRSNPTGAEQNAIANYRSADTQEAVYLRAYLRIATAPAVGTNIYVLAFYGLAAGQLRVQVRLNSSRELQLWNAEDAAQVDALSSALSLDTWYRLELKLDTTTLASSAVEAKIDGTTFASGTIDLTAGAARVAFLGNNGTHDLYLDDIAVNDSSGTTQNSWPGEGSIVHLKPDAAGDNAMGLNQGSAPAATGWESVDEVPPDDAVTYHNLDANNDILDVNLESSATAGITSGMPITLVQVGERHTGASASNYTYNTRIKSQASGTVISGTAVTTSATTFGTNTGANPRVYQLTRYTDPQAGGAWTTALLDTTQIGVIATDAAPDVYISTLWALVEYVPVVDATGTVTAGSLAVAGQAVTATADSLATVATGSHTVAGQAVTADPGALGAVGTGSHSASGQAITSTADTLATIATGSHATTGQTVTGQAGTLATVATGSHAVSGQAVAATAGATGGVATGSHAVSGQAVSGVGGALATIGTGSHAVSGQTVTGTEGGAPVTGTVDTGSLAVAGQAVTGLAGSLGTVATGSHTVSGQAVTGTEGPTPATGDIASGTLAVSGQSVTAQTGSLASVATGSHAVSAQAVTAASGTAATVSTGTLAAVGQIVAASVDELVSLIAGTMAVSGGSVSSTAGTEAVVATGALAVSGQTITAVIVAPATAGTLSATLTVTPVLSGDVTLTAILSGDLELAPILTGVLEVVLMDTIFEGDTLRATLSALTHDVDGVITSGATVTVTAYRADGTVIDTGGATYDADAGGWVRSVTVPALSAPERLRAKAVAVYTDGDDSQKTFQTGVTARAAVG
jgi:hypothetical protein